LPSGETENGVRRWCGRPVQYAGLIQSKLEESVKELGKLEMLEMLASPRTEVIEPATRAEMSVKRIFGKDRLIEQKRKE
jgi:hypothetical protein